MTLVSNGRHIDEARLPPKNRAGTIIYVDSVSGSDTNDGYIAPLATLVEALARIPDNFSGKYEVECRGPGPYYPPAKLPAPSPLDGLTLDIVGDRSVPYVSNASPSWSVVAGTTTRFSDASFGAHSGLTADGYWLEVDISGLIPDASTINWPIYATGPGTNVEIAGAIVFAVPSTVYEIITTLEWPKEAKTVGHYEAAALGNVRFIGFRVETATAEGCAFQGCDFRGFNEFINSAVGGHIGPTGTNTIFIRGGQVSRLQYFYASGGTISLQDKVNVGGYFETTISLGIGFRSAEALCVGDVDSFVSGAPAIEYSCQGSSWNQTSNFISFGGGTTSVFAPRDETASGATFSISAVGVRVQGTVTGDAFVLQNGSGAINLDSEFTALTVGGNDVTLDGAPANFTDSDVFSLNSGCFLRT